MECGRIAIAAHQVVQTDSIRGIIIVMASSIIFLLVSKIVIFIAASDDALSEVEVHRI